MTPERAEQYWNAKTAASNEPRIPSVFSPPFVLVVVIDDSDEVAYPAVHIITSAA